MDEELLTGTEVTQIHLLCQNLILAHKNGAIKLTAQHPGTSPESVFLAAQLV